MLYITQSIQCSWFSPALVTLFAGVIKSCQSLWKKVSYSPSIRLDTLAISSGSDMWHNLLSLQLLLLALFAWQNQCNAECCRATDFTFDLIDKTKECSDYPNAETASILKAADCQTSLCGHLVTPTPYCGVGSCNLFGCDCHLGCLSAANETLAQLKEKYDKEIKNIKEDWKEVWKQNIYK